jgi:DnaJ-class molecular chaperone
MSDERLENLPTGQDQPGTAAMNPGDEVPAGTPGAGENICPDCGGTGRSDGAACKTCGGTGTVIEAVSGGA